MAVNDAHEPGRRDDVIDVQPQSSMDAGAAHAMHPPLQGGELSRSLRVQASSWPTIIGVIAIALGAFGALGGLWGIVSPLFMDAIMPNAPGQAEAIAAMDAWMPMMMLVSALGGLLALVLLAGGVLLAMRRPQARTILLTWAIAKMVLVIGQLVATFAVQRETMDAVMSSAPPGGPPPQFMQMMLWFGLALALLWGWALPVFMLIWFSRTSVKQDVRQWGSPAVGS